MKILAVSDQVVENLYSPEVGQRFGDIDLILGCGDLPDYYLEFLVSTLNVPLYYVHGNHDQTFGDSSAGTRKFRARGCELLDSRVAEVGGLLLALLPTLGWLYFVPMLWITADLMYSNIKLIADPSPTHARAMFMASNKYLLILLLAICIDSSLPFLK